MYFRIVTRGMGERGIYSSAPAPHWSSVALWGRPGADSERCMALSVYTSVELVAIAIARVKGGLRG